VADPLELAAGVLRRARNAVDYLREADLADACSTPTEDVWTAGKVRLRRVVSRQVESERPLLIVHSLISKPYIFDLLPGNSVLEWLRDHGHDVYLLDWGDTDETDVANDLATYVDDYLRPAVAAVRNVSGAGEVAMLGYCFGGLLALLALATDDGLPVSDLALVATPVDFHEITALRRATRPGRLEARQLLDSTGNIPPRVFRWAFRTLRPTNDLAALVTVIDRLDDRASMRNHHALSRWTDDQIPFAGALAEEMLPVARDNGLLNGTVRVGGRRADFGAVRARVLAFMALRDHLVPYASATPIARLLPNADVDTFEIDSGHVALLVGARAQGKTLPALHDWLTTDAHRTEEEDRHGRAPAPHP
jgi:polyhydroxyalkanoate synthase subunit PhaC